VNRDFVTRSRYREGGRVVVQHAKSCAATNNLAIFLFYASARRRRAHGSFLVEKGHFIGILVGNAS
jgi:hypothetical protein